MTIREYLKRRTRLFMGAGVAGWLVAAGSMFFLRPEACRPACGNHPIPPAVFLGMPIFFAAIMGLTFFVKCPRCNGRLGALGVNTFSRGFFSRPINFCPYCGVSLDERYDDPSRL